MGGLTGWGLCGEPTHPEPKGKGAPGEGGLVHGGRGAGCKQWPGLSAGSGLLWWGVPHVYASLTAEKSLDWHCQSRSCLMRLW